MKKKTYFQKSILLFLVLLMMLFFLAVSVYAIVWIFLEKSEKTVHGIFLFLGSIVISAYMVYSFIRMARNRIILNKDEIFVPEHWGRADEKLQFETRIRYDEIEDIFIIALDKNSLNESPWQPVIPMPYIIFECKNDVQKAINVFYYSKKQIVNIIDEAVMRAKMTNNDIDITGEKVLSEYIEVKKNNQN